MLVMSADAIAVFRPQKLDRLTPFLDLDDESDESDGLYAEMLEDGAVLVHTFQPFEAFRDDPRAVAEWLAQFGDALADIHDDERGLFFFPDSIEPEATKYDALIDEVSAEGEGVFLPANPAALEQLASLTAAVQGAGIDMNALQGFAAQLAGGGGGNGGSFEMGKLLTDLSEQLMGALGTPNAPAGRDDKK
jgi:hypothetical protein